MRIADHNLKNNLSLNNSYTNPNAGITHPLRNVIIVGTKADLMSSNPEIKKK
jgi:hypothetical protein